MKQIKRYSTNETAQWLKTETDQRLISVSTRQNGTIMETFLTSTAPYFVSTDVCVYNGVTYDDGDSFPAGDGCNSW